MDPAGRTGVYQTSCRRGNRMTDDLEQHPRAATGSAHRLEAHRLVKRFHGHAAVSDVSFTLGPGDILGYLGPNGSGKSMTLKMLTGLIEPTTGRVTYSGVDVTGGHIEFRKRFGYVPEEPHL